MASALLQERPAGGAVRRRARPVGAAIAPELQAEQLVDDLVGAGVDARDEVVPARKRGAGLRTDPHQVIVCIPTGSRLSAGRARESSFRAGCGK